MNNVLHYMNYNAPYQGNFIKSIIKLEERIVKAGGCLIYLFPKEVSEKAWANDLVNQSKRVYFLTGKVLQDLAIIDKIVRDFNIKVIHTHFASVKDHSYFNLIRTVRDGHIRIVRHLHNHYKKNNFLVEKAKLVLSGVDYYVGCSQSVAEHHRQLNNIEETKVKAVPNAVDFNRLSNYTDSERNRLGIDAETKVILVFGFDYYRKGVDIALEAISDLVNEGANLCLLLSLSTNKEEVLSKINLRFGSVPDWIRVVDARDDIATYYKASDVFVSCSRSEGFCYSLVEAAYCQTSIIASDIPGQNSLNIPYTLQFTSQDKEQLKQQIVTAVSLDDDERLKQLEVQKAFVQKEYDLSEWSERILAIYQSFPN